MKQEQGFTLIELMVVVAIIGALAAIAIPKYADFRIKASNAAAESDLKNFATTISLFGTNYPNPTSATAPNDIILTNGTSTQRLTLSDGVTIMLLLATSLHKRCMFSKHVRGDVVMYSNTDFRSITRSVEVAGDAGLLLTNAGAYAAAQTTACSI